MRVRAIWAAALAWTALGGCDARPRPAEPSAGHVAPPPGEADEAFARLQAYEDQQRLAHPGAALRPWSKVAGDDPWLVYPLDGQRAIGLLRGADAAVVLDERGRELQRVATVTQPIAVAVHGEAVWVVGAPGELQRFGLRDGQLQPGDRMALPGAVALRDAVALPHGLALSDGWSGQVLQLGWDGALVPEDARPCRGAFDLHESAGLLASVCLHERGLRLDHGEVHTTASHDGPLWSSAITPLAGGGWLVAAGGVEDHPLDRTDGAFGFVDSFLFLERVQPCAQGLCRHELARIDVAPMGIIVPKWLAVTADAEQAEVTLSSYGGDAFVQLAVSLADGSGSTTRSFAVPPGIRDAGRMAGGWLAADPLLDRWVRIDDDGTVSTELPRDPRPGAPPSVRVGEALFFTRLMAPAASSEGRASRFTCETCHFEGTVDGRVHYTGRQDVHAATKPLLGLFVNRPHFSRALDRTLATMVDNEFTVANRGSAAGPRFDATAQAWPWLALLGAHETQDADALRRALIDFFVAYDHESSPAVVARRRSSAAPRFTDQERAGADSFAQHCEGCHQARTIADDPSTRVDPTQWESLVLSERGPLVWASEQRVRTGVEPYVHPEGARVTSLRRLWLKWPYFTNGSAHSIADVLARVRLRPVFAHAGEGAGDLDAAEQRALAAFLALL